MCNRRESNPDTYEDDELMERYRDEMNVAAAQPLPEYLSTYGARGWECLSVPAIVCIAVKSIVKPQDRFWATAHRIRAFRHGKPLHCHSKLHSSYAQIRLDEGSSWPSSSERYSKVFT
ncbi:hypothetical protein BX070DRAFT_243963 [Coemansia spiralis]|nr:hypothetical protein BX070DRAFT_243963 [Coemansia spiralis]